MLTKNNPFQSWVGFTRALEMEFGSSPYECPRSTLFKLTQTAKLYKEKYSPQHRTFQTHSLTKNPSYSINQTHKTTSLPPLLPTPTSNQPTQPQTKFSNVKNLTVVKIKLRCFTCDEKFSPSHKCPNTILLDSGSSDNFLQPQLAHCLKLPVEPTSSFQVLVGNGHALIVEGMVRNVEVMIQGHSLHLPVYLLPVSGVDLVLGAAWLANWVHTFQIIVSYH
uniref:Retrotransposon gag domain-containing protein n=1 Tax=Cajanus cajan TaxID=3821 RepID=A0A151TEL5_CAJCA|nr:hypothetical protein KK1_011736 [Cajanus cajan]